MTSVSAPRAAIAALSPSRAVAALIVGLTLVKLVVAAWMPLAFDEALYWRYSRHLAAGYIDHPFMNPLMIRIGTGLFGDTPFGIRCMGVLLSLPASWAVWRAGADLFEDEALGRTAALLFNVTVVMTVGALLATSDQVVVTTSALLLYGLGRLHRTGRGAWWPAIGAAFGLGLCSKYTTAFFAVSLGAWMVLAGDARRRLLSPWPWAGGLVAVALFSPVLLWNAQHHWASFVYQAGRLTTFRWTFQYLLELVVALVMLATPPVFVLGCVGVGRMLARDGEHASARALIVLMIAPMVAYFLWHATHKRVQGNWPEPIYPALCIAAAYAVRRGRDSSGTAAAAWTDGARRWAVPFGLGVAALVYLEALSGIIPFGAHDPRARALGVGWPQLAARIDALRAAEGATVILTTDYTLNSWTRFYLPSATPIEQIDERVRWANEPALAPEVLQGTALYVCGRACTKLHLIQDRFRSVRLVGVLPRSDGERLISSYRVYSLSGPTRPVLDAPVVVPRADHDD